MRLTPFHSSQPLIDLVDPLQESNERVCERVHPLAIGAGHLLIRITPGLVVNG